MMFAPWVHRETKSDFTIPLSNMGECVHMLTSCMFTVHVFVPTYICEWFDRADVSSLLARYSFCLLVLTLSARVQNTKDQLVGSLV